MAATYAVLSFLAGLVGSGLVFYMNQTLRAHVERRAARQDCRMVASSIAAVLLGMGVKRSKGLFRRDVRMLSALVDHFRTNFPAWQARFGGAGLPIAVAIPVFDLRAALDEIEAVFEPHQIRLDGEAAAPWLDRIAPLGDRILAVSLEGQVRAVDVISAAGRSGSIQK